MITPIIKITMFISLFAIGCSKPKETPAKVPHTYEINIKFIDQTGNNLLANMAEDGLNGDIKISSPDGKVIASGTYIKSYNGENLLTILVNSDRDDFLESIDYSINNLSLTGSTTDKLIRSTWKQMNNTAVIETVYYNSSEIDPIQHSPPAALVYYPIVKP